MANKHDALLQLGRLLKSAGYRFTTITPESHRLVNARPLTKRASLADIFGWSRNFAHKTAPEPIVELLREADELDRADDMFRSRVRYSSVDEMLFLHSAFPTREPDAVFFGPDTYRFIRSLRVSMPSVHARPLRIFDIGCGSGAGGLFVASALGPDMRPETLLTDINPRALVFARVNAELNEVPAAVFVESDILASVAGDADFIVSNPPYLLDPRRRAYRHGAGEFGLDLSLRILNESLERLRCGGRLVLYTGVAILDGFDPLLEVVRTELAGKAFTFHYEEVDPDVFGEELAHPPYDRADRIAAVVLIADRHSEP